jgi:hypothetical protein
LLVRRGECRGRLDRSAAHPLERRSSGVALSQRRFHLCAVQGETERQAAACLSDISSKIIN